MDAPHEGHSSLIIFLAKATLKHHHAFQKNNSNYVEAEPILYESSPTVLEFD